MPSHLRIHSFTGNSDHNFTGLVPNELLKLNSSGTAIESYGTASTISLSSITNVDYIDFTLIPSPAVAYQEGRIHWDDNTKTLQIETSDSAVPIEVGHNNLVYVRNTMATTVTAGTVVYMSGQSGNRPTIAISSNDSDPNSMATVGLVSADISPSTNGYVTTYGLLRGINTNAYTSGQMLYLGTNGGITTTRPVAPLHDVRLGKVVTAAASGIIFVDVMNGYELNELHDVYYATSAQTQNNLLYWDTGNTRWQSTGATAIGLVKKYSTTLTTPGAGVTNTITHNLGTTDITATLWLVTTGDMTSARITNRQTNSVDVIFSSAPGENVRVVITG